MNIIRISKDIYKIVIIKECHLSALKSPFGLLHIINVNLCMYNYNVINSYYLMIDRNTYYFKLYL